MRIIRFQIIKPFCFFLSNYQPFKPMEVPPEQAKSHNYRSEQNYQKQIRTTLVRVKRWFQCRSQDPCGATVLPLQRKTKDWKKEKKLDGELLWQKYYASIEKWRSRNQYRWRWWRKLSINSFIARIHSPVQRSLVYYNEKNFWLAWTGKGVQI